MSKYTLRAGIELLASREKAEAFVLCSLFMGLRAGNDPTGFNRFADDLEAVWCWGGSGTFSGMWVILSDSGGENRFHGV